MSRLCLVSRITNFAVVERAVEADRGAGGLLDKQDQEPMRCKGIKLSLKIDYSNK